MESRRATMLFSRSPSGAEEDGARKLDLDLLKKPPARGGIRNVGDGGGIDRDRPRCSRLSLPRPRTAAFLPQC